MMINDSWYKFTYYIEHIHTEIHGSPSLPYWESKNWEVTTAIGNAILYYLHVILEVV